MAGDYTLTVTDANGCSDDDTTSVVVTECLVTYNLTVTSNGCCPIDVSGAASGTVSAGGSQTFLGIGEGENVTVSADDSAVCCEFDSWSDAGAQTHNITMDDDKSVTAYCSVPSYNLTVNVSPGGGGNVTVNGTTPSGYPDTTTWTCGEEVTVNAVAASGYEFVNWSGDLSGSVNPTNITMTSTKNVTAHFSAITYNLTVISDGCCPIDVSGAASGTVSAGGSQTFTGIGEGENVTVSADDSAVCCEFVNWSDAGAQTHNITMNSDTTVTAYCSVPSYNLTINVSPGGGGNVTVNGTTPSGYPDTTTWTCGEEVTVNAVAAGGYEFDHWSGDLSGNATPTNITMDGDYSIVANFKGLPPELSYSPLSFNLTTREGTNPPDQTLDIWNSGGGILNWSISDDAAWLSESPTNGSLRADEHVLVTISFNTSGLDVDVYSANITITGSVHIVPVILVVAPTGIYNLTINSTAGGNVTTPGEGTFTYNASQVVDLVATPDANYHFVNWTGNLTGSTNPTNITMNGNYTIVANFEEGIDVMRDLPADALDYDAEYPGDSFWVYVNFTAPVDDFNSIGMTDYAPPGWLVETDNSWCVPPASYNKSNYNKAEYSWSGPGGGGGWAAGTKFSAKYNVTIPATAVPGSNYWPGCDPLPCPPCSGSPINMFPAWVEYWFGPAGPYETVICEEREKIVTVPGCETGETRDVVGDVLDTVTVNLWEDDDVWEDQDTSSIVGTIAVYEDCADDTGMYYKVASKYCYYSLNTRPTGDGGTMPLSRNPAYPDYVDWSTPEKLAAGNVLNFVGDYGLICKAASMSYAMEAVNHMLFIPLGDDGITLEPDWQLSGWKVTQVVHSWQFPCGCNC